MFRPVYPAHIADDLRPPTLGELIRRQRELAGHCRCVRWRPRWASPNAYLSQIEPTILPSEPSERVLGAIADQLGLWLDILIAEGNRASSDDGLTEPASVRCHPLATSEQYPVHHPLDPSLVGITMAQLLRSRPFTSEPPPQRGHRVHRTVKLGQPDQLHRLHRPGHPAVQRDRPGGRRCMRAVSSADSVRTSGTRVSPARVFTGRILEHGERLGDVDASCPRSPATVIIVFANYVLDPTDRFPTGFTVADIWRG